MRMPRYHVSDNKYGVNFDRRDYTSEDVQAHLLETSHEFRELVFRQLHEQQQLAPWHGAERLSAILKWKKDNGLTVKGDSDE